MKQESSAGRERKQPIAVEVATYWGDTLLDVRQLRRGESFQLGEGNSAEKCDVPMGPELIGAPQVALVSIDGEGRVDLAVLAGSSLQVEAPGLGELDLGQSLRRLSSRQLGKPVGAHQVRLPRGAVAEVTLGEMAFRVSVTQPAAKLRAITLGRAAWTLAGCCALSMAAHGCVGGAAYLAPASEQGAGAMTDSQRYLVQYYLDQIDERRLEEMEREALETEAAEDLANREGGSGTRARGEEGSMGSRTGNRYGVRGPGGQPRNAVARQGALRQAHEFGMIGLLDSGAGGDPDAPTSPWGRDDSLGARGNMWGDSVGPAHRSGGLGLSGTGTGQGFGSGHGRGGGGTGIGLGSMGSVGHGAGPGAPRVRYGTPNHRVGRSHRPIQAPAYSPPVVHAPIDPNGRFSTTYRPGRGHLSAFEAAVARGAVPGVARELVSDVGARYAPGVDVGDEALGYRVDLERAALPPSGGKVHLRLALQSSAVSAAGRPRLSVVVVLDQSGSMKGEAIERAKEAAGSLVDRLAPADEFSLISFSDEARIRVPVGFVGQRKKAIRAAIAEIEATGGTNIGEGLAHAYRQARVRAESGDAIPVVLLLSDGQPTVGERSPGRISAQALEAFQDGIQTSTFGLGTSYDGNLMSAVASDGAGGYYYLRDAEQIGAAFRAELDQRLDPAATAVEIRVRLNPDVELLHVYGSQRLGQLAAARERAKEVAADHQAGQRYGIKRDRQQDNKGGMRFFIPSFARDDSYALLLQVSVPAGQQKRRVGVMELKYKDRILGRNVSEEVPIFVEYAASDSASVATLDPSVARTVHGHRAGEDLLRAARQIAAGNRPAAAAVLSERERVLRAASAALEEPGFLTDAARFSRLLAHAGGEQHGSLTEPYALAMVLETAGRAHLR